MPSTKPVVFISSTAKDLLQHREAAERAARRAGFDWEMMEDFEAQSHTPAYPACMEKVRKCDVLVVLVAHRYGWVPSDQPTPKDAKSITWLECEEIRRFGKEVLPILLDPAHPWPAEQKESYRAAEATEIGKHTGKLQKEITRNVKKLGEFKGWLDSLGFRRTFTTPAQLEAEVLDQLSKWLTRHPDFHANAAPVPKDDPAEYLSQLREQTRWIDIRGLQVGAAKAYRFDIDDLYIPLTTSAGALSENAPRKRGPRTGRVGRGAPYSAAPPVRLEQPLTNSRLLIEGDPGAGKTTFLRHIAYELCRDDGKSSFKIGPGFPIFIRIGDLEEHIANCGKHSAKDAPPNADTPSWLIHYLATQSTARNWNLSEAFFKARFQDPKTTILLDGLDEASSTRMREAIVKLLLAAVASYKHCRFVVTTRPQSYTGNAKLPGFHEVRIDELEPAAIATFLSHWSKCLYPDDKKQAEAHHEALSEALNARPRIRKMARNPVMLTALAVVHWNERRLPEQRADLYQSITLWLARARDSKPGRESADRVLALLGHLALGMQKEEKGRAIQVSRGRAAEIIAPQFREIRDPQAQLDRARAFLLEEEVDSGIFITRGADLRFWHLTLQEYLAARTIAGMTEAAQQKLLFVKDRRYKPEWREVMLLLGGTLIGQGTDKVDNLFAAMLGQTKPDAALAGKALCVGLIGQMLSDLNPYSYNLPDPRYDQMLHEVLAIFEREQSKTLSAKQRFEAAESLGQAGDPRLRLPHQDDYWVTIAAGEFTMGDGKERDNPKHQVFLDKFQIGRRTVTVYEYGLFLEDNESTVRVDWAEQSIHQNRPVVNVSWEDATAYCRWVAKRTTGVRLPTEAEWERAARGTEGRVYPWGDQPPTPELANYAETGLHSVSPVGLFPNGSTATPDDIQDLAGNVWEWVSDWYQPHSYTGSPARNPKGPDSGDYRCVRGGSYVVDAAYLRAATRYRYDRDSSVYNFGFRCLRE